jgi:hypothetical protein
MLVFLFYYDFLFFLTYKLYHSHVCIGKSSIRRAQYSEVSGIYWGLWNISPFHEWDYCTSILFRVDDDLFKGYDHFLQAVSGGLAPQ